MPRRSQTKDADNLLKDLLDGLKGVSYVDDRQIPCLTSRRTTCVGGQGYYLVRAIAVHPFNGDVVATGDVTRPLFL